jgi:hypothetical protein
MAGEDVAARIERLTTAIEGLEDRQARMLAEQLSLAVIELHGEGLAALVASLGPGVVRRACENDAVAGMLMLHGLHPVPIDERVRGALAEIGDAELVELVDGVARLRLADCQDPATVERALQSLVPDLAGLSFERPGAGIPLPMAASP